MKAVVIFHKIKMTVYYNALAFEIYDSCSWMGLLSSNLTIGPILHYMSFYEFYVVLVFPFKILSVKLLMFLMVRLIGYP